jgi:hypothetical protein
MHTYFGILSNCHWLLQEATVASLFIKSRTYEDMLWQIINYTRSLRP